MKKFLILIFIFVAGALLLYYISTNFRKDGDNVAEVSSPVPTKAAVTSVADNCKIYTSSALNYTISYPENFVVEPSGDYSNLILKPLQEPSFGPANFIYVSVVPPDQSTNEGEIYNYNQVQFKKLAELEIGGSVSLADTDQPKLNEWFTYTRVNDSVIDGHPAKRFENNKPWEFPAGTTEVRFVFESGGKIYLMGYYYGGEGMLEPLDPLEANKIITTFQLN